MKSRAFTLIELLVVISIISLLSSVVMSSLSAAREKARIAAAKSFDALVKHGIGDQAVGEWLFEGASSAAIDTSSLGHSGTVYGATWSQGGGFDGGDAYTFDGNDYIEVPYSPDFDLGAFTISLWAKPSPSIAAGYHGLLSKQGATRDYNVYGYTTTTGVIERIHFSSSAYGGPLIALPEAWKGDTWHHLVVSVSATGKMTFYSDGKVFYTSQVVPTVMNNAYPIWIGRADNYWMGTIDNVRVYSASVTN